MKTRRDTIVYGLTGSAAALASLQALAAEPSSGTAVAVGSALLDAYVAAVNAHDTSRFPELFAESYIQHSGRSPSGLAAQIENFRRIFTVMPDVRMQVEDRIIAGDKMVARTIYSATHTQTVLGFAPTGKPFTFRTIDIWRIEKGKLAEHWDLTDTAEVLRRLSSN